MMSLAEKSLPKVGDLQGFHGETRTRTGDTTIFSRVLYQLSYLALGGDASEWERGAAGGHGAAPATWFTGMGA
jgi:hypothetical protein